MGWCPEIPCVITEWCSKGSLAGVLKQAAKLETQELSWACRLKIALGIAKVMVLDRFASYLNLGMQLITKHATSCAINQVIVSLYFCHSICFALCASHSPMLAKTWPHQDFYSVAASGLQGMLYLHTHEPPIVHGNLSSKSVLIDVNWQAKITGFGLCHMNTTPQPPRFSHSPDSTPFLAPEVCQDLYTDNLCSLNEQVVSRIL